MPEPTQFRCREARPLPEAPEEAIGQAAGTTGQVGARERVRDESIGGHVVAEGAIAAAHAAEVFVGLHAVEGIGAVAFETAGAAGLGVDVVGATAAGAAGSGVGSVGLGLAAAGTVGMPLAAGLAGVFMIVHADGEVARRGEVYAGGRQLGALLVLEGRDGSPEMLRLRAELAARGDHDSQMRLAGLLDGAAAANRWLDAHPCEGRQLTARIRLSVNEGQLAVASGADRGASFERRMARDPAFKDGVDYMRRLRDERPAEFEARATDVRAMMSQVDSSRRAAARM